MPIFTIIASFQHNYYMYPKSLFLKISIVKSTLYTYAIPCFKAVLIQSVQNSLFLIYIRTVIVRVSHRIAS